MDFSKYLWILTTISLTGTILNCRKNFICFFLLIIGEVLWFIYDFYNGTYSRAILDIVSLALAIYGIYEWKKK